MSESFEQIDSVRVFFKDGSCAFLKNHGLNVNAVITQLTEERAALAAENERLRKAGDAMDSYIKKLEERISVIAAKEGGAK